MPTCRRKDPSVAQRLHTAHLSLCAFGHGFPAWMQIRCGVNIMELLHIMRLKPWHSHRNSQIEACLLLGSPELPHLKWILNSVLSS